MRVTPAQCGWVHVYDKGKYIKQNGTKTILDCSFVNNKAKIISIKAKILIVIEGTSWMECLKRLWIK